jgi:hypothetical protein
MLRAAVDDFQPSQFGRLDFAFARKFKWHGIRTALQPVGHAHDHWPPSNKGMGLIPLLPMRPRLRKDECNNAGRTESFALDGVLIQTVLRDDRPTTLACERLKPVSIRRYRGKLLV